jgi:hypothetical protein
MTSEERAATRLQIDAWLAQAAQGNFLVRHIALASALLEAERIEVSGEPEDTRRLANVLARNLEHYAQRGDERPVLLLSAKLLAVLNDVADDGDEEAARDLNECVAGLDAFTVSLGCAQVARRNQGLM